MFKIFRQLTGKDWAKLGFCVVLIVAQVWLDLKMPDYTKRLTETVSAGSVSMDDVWGNGGMMLLCAVGSMAAAILCGLFITQVAANLARVLRLKLFGQVMDFSDTEINKFSTPSLITRTTNDVVRIQTFAAIGLQVLIKAPIMAVWAILKISATNIEWTMATFVTVAIIVVIVAVVMALCIPKFKLIQKLTDGLNRATRENLSGVRVIRAFNAEKYQERKFEKVNTSITKNELFTSRATGLLMPVMTLAMSGLTLAIYWIGAYLVNNVAITERAVMIGNMTAFTQYALQVVMAFMLLVIVFAILPRVLVSAKRINEVLDTEIGIKYPEERVQNLSEKGKVEFRNVAFMYVDGTTPAIEKISFTIEPGQTFAVIGPTGSGKSSIVNLMTRFHDVTKGEVLIDGVNIKEFPKLQLEEIVSLAPQKAILFKGSIRSNVAYGQKKEERKKDAKVKRALEIAKADFVSSLERGLDAEVEQGGANFSGGQKQRLSIARAVFRGAEIVIFDDSLSALDYKTDRMVREQIREKLKGTTVVIVAQRIGTIKNADQILVMDENGQIAGIGKHEVLLKKCPLYKEIALSQLSEEELA